jgi:DNA replication protein DnaC
MSTYAERISQLCSEFKLPTVGSEAVPHFMNAGHSEALESLTELLEMEAEDRRQRRIVRLRRASKLPPGKVWDTFEHDRLPIRLRQQLLELAQGEFVEQGMNVLAFGLPGTGKTHAMCAIGHRLVEAGRSVLFTPAYRLVQDLLAAKRDLELPRALRKLDNFDLLLIDDLGYLPQGAEESEVLFTLMAERYERRALGITSNLVFSDWDKIFQNPMATAAAIDRVVHHSVILEFNVSSYRTGAAEQRQRDNQNDHDRQEVNRQK